MTEPVPVVGAAIVHAGRLLACRRTGPPALAGRWEFPGGKVEAGESAAAALARECREELGLDVRVGARLGGDVHVGAGPDGAGGIVLRVFWCTVVGAAELRLADHDAACWLGADEVFDVPWIEADLGLVAQARDRLEGLREGAGDG